MVKVVDFGIAQEGSPEPGEGAREEGDAIGTLRLEGELGGGAPGAEIAQVARRPGHGGAVRRDPAAGLGRAPFAHLRGLLEEANRASVYPRRLTELSMGMSSDFKEAILEGSTMVRVGTALFGERS